MQDPLDHEVYGVMHEIDARKLSDDTPIDEMSGRRANIGIYSGQNWHSDYYERGREGEDSSFLYIHGSWGGPE
jgi:hypothetical protein